MSDRRSKVVTIMDAKAATGVGTTIYTKDFQFVNISIAGATSPSLTVKCKGSISNEEPTFGSASSVTNVWDTVLMYDYQDGASIAGDTGVAFAGTADVRQFRINVDGLQWVNFDMTAYAAGAVTIKAFCTNNA